MSAPDLLEPPPVGTDLVVRGKLRVPGELHNPGAFDRSRSLATDGIFRDLRLKGPTADLVFLASGAAYPLGERLRGGIRQLLKPLDAGLRAIYLSMLLGDQGEVTPEMRRNLARTGTSHLLVVNGLHLGMVAAVIFFLGSWLLRRSAWLLLRLNVVKTATLLAAAAVVGYAWVAGGSPSTQRAEVMVLAFLLLIFLGRPREFWSALALAALIILSLTPLRLFSISFQLSFAAVAALIYLMPRILRLGEQPPPLISRPAWEPASTPVEGMGSGLGGSHPGHRPPGGRLLPGGLSFGDRRQSGGHPLVPAVGPALGRGCGLRPGHPSNLSGPGPAFFGPIASLAGLAGHSLGAALPGSAIIVPIPTWLQIGLYYLILILVFAPRRSFWTWGGAGLAGLALLISRWPGPWLWDPGALEVTCLDTYGDLSGMVVSPEGQRLVCHRPGALLARTHGSPAVPSARCPPTATGANSAPWTRRWPSPFPRTMPGNCSPWPSSSTWGVFGMVAGVTPGRPCGICGIIWATGAACPCPWNPGAAGPSRPPSLGSVRA